MVTTIIVATETRGAYFPAAPATFFAASSAAACAWRAVSLILWFNVLSFRPPVSGRRIYPFLGTFRKAPLPIELLGAALSMCLNKRKARGENDEYSYREPDHTQARQVMLIWRHT